MPATCPHNRFPRNRPTARAFIGLRGSVYGSLRPLANNGQPDRHVEDQLHARKIDRDPCKVELIDDAEWQPGVTPNSGKFRITLNGEPVPGAVAASETAGWVDVIPVPENPERWESYDLFDELLCNAGRERLTGTVKIVRDRFE